ncbi:phosphatidylserine decarboxylase [Angomonas deanei]|nr:phosphatidylserine decarboxylase [Angomonas deanei]|eukprot:EPY41622.1 phosphatidylserine decarboxylase [Angomonas deanei]
MCSSTFTDVLYMLPLNYTSDTLGFLSESEYIPKAVHQWCIDFLIWWYHVNMEDSATTQFDTAQEFYTRKWKEGARPVDDASLVSSPCDGVVTTVQDDVTNDTVVQVKGVTYRVQALVQADPGPVPPSYKRVLFTVYMRAKDYHHVISPFAFHTKGIAYVPGTLFPATPAGVHWIPGLFTTNERVVVYGHVQKDAAKRNKTLKEGEIVKNPFCAVVLVGSTLTGKIRLAIDRQVRTNFLDPPDYTVFKKLPHFPLLRAGQPVGWFQWGSTVAVLVDVPVDSKVVIQVNDEIKAGQAVLTRP